MVGWSHPSRSVQVRGHIAGATPCRRARPLCKHAVGPVLSRILPATTALSIRLSRSRASTTIERFERGSTPRYQPSPPTPVIRIDNSWSSFPGCRGELENAHETSVSRTWVREQQGVKSERNGTESPEPAPKVPHFSLNCSPPVRGMGVY